MAASKAVCIMANMGTLGDFKPAMVTAAHLALQGWRVSVLAQPKDKDYTMQKMSTAVGFEQAVETELQLVGSCQEHVFHPPVGCPPKVVTAEVFHPVSYICKKASIGTVSGEGRLVLYFPTADQAMDEEAYQTASEPNKAAVKKDTFGNFLGLWQGAVDALRQQEDLPDLVLTNCYDREGNMGLFEKAMSYTSQLKIRVGHLGLGDAELTDKWHANSSLLAPQKLFGKDVAAVTKRGVIVEPQTIFPAEGLPTVVAAFLAAKPSAIVVLSSVSKQWTNAIENVLPGSDAYQVLFVNAASREPVKAGHLRYPAPLADLDAAFAAASLVIHGGGVGISEQAVRSGKPSICLSSMVEQELNGARLEALGLAKHFKIASVLEDGFGFCSTVQDFFEGSIELFDDVAVLSAQRQVGQESALALPALAEHLLKISAQA